MVEFYGGGISAKNSCALESKSLTLVQSNTSDEIEVQTSRVMLSIAAASQTILQGHVPKVMAVGQAVL